jgi:hypothetical protein
MYRPKYRFCIGSGDWPGEDDQRLLGTDGEGEKWRRCNQRGAA